MSGTAMTQINVRIPLELKEQGDRGLREIGISATGAIRALWSILASRGESFECARDLLLGDVSGPSQTIDDQGPLARGWEFVDECVRELGLSALNVGTDESVTDEDLLAAALDERMRERGVC